MLTTKLIQKNKNKTNRFLGAKITKIMREMIREHHTEAMDGNSAAAHIAYALSDTSFIYPITPSSAMGEHIDHFSAKKKKNIFGEQVTVQLMQSEGGAAGAVHGALAAGALTSTYTSSQGLLLMVPNMFKMSSALMPAVMHVAARAIIGHIGSMFCDHSDVMHVRSTGWSLLSSNNQQEVMDLALVAHLAALESSIPFLHFFDGFRTSHGISKINVIDYDDIKKLVDMKYVDRFHSVAFNPEHPSMRGTPVGDDAYFQWHTAPLKYFQAVPEIVEKVMKRVGDSTGRYYNLFEYFGAPDAEDVIVMMGSSSDTAQEAVDYINDKGGKVGLIKVRLYRPFSATHFLKTLPKTVRRITVLDRVREYGAFAQPLYLDVNAVIREPRSGFNPNIEEIVPGIYGLGGKDLTPGMAIAAFENMKKKEPKRNFSVGIVDDVTNTHLAYNFEPDLVPKGTKQCLFWGLGSDGTVGANKEAIAIIGENTDLNAQGYFMFDAKKSGGLTFSHLRFGPKKITSQYDIRHADYLAFHNPSFIARYPQVINKIKDNATFVINTPAETWEELDKQMPDIMKGVIAKKNVRLFVIDAEKLADQLGLRGRINMIMQTVFFKLSEVIPFDKAIKYLKDSIVKNYKKQGEAVVNKNIAMVDIAVSNVKEIHYPKAKWAELYKEDFKMPTEIDPNAPENVKKYIFPAMRLEAANLPVSAFPVNGQSMTSTSKYEKRGIATKLPIWKPENCTQCNICSFVCPHAAIRPFILDHDEKSRKPEGYQTIESNVAEYKKLGYQFRVQVSPYDCLSCELCVKQCPANALDFENADKSIMEKEKKNWEFSQKIKNKADLLKSATVATSQYKQPLLEFSGACAGCGQTPYLKLITQLYGDRAMIANATGCSIIWGGHYPSFPYTVNDKGHGPSWGNSLFEDNAEYGYGMVKAMIHRRNQLATHVKKALDSYEISDPVERYTFEEWLLNKDLAKESQEFGDKIKKVISSKKVLNSPSLEHISKNLDILTKPSHWIIGGDGWAYDIGFGGLDHILAQEEDYNVLVFDNAFYANTGFQMSKATPRGAQAKFAMAGKDTKAKDLGLMAMQYGHIYIATVAMGANYNQFLKAIKEAEAYPGPSLIIAYCPCIGHGIKTGMCTTQQQQKLAVEHGLWNLWRFNPALKLQGKNPLILDSKKPKKLLLDFLKMEVRFAALYQTHPKEAEAMHNKLEEEVKEKYETLVGLSKMYEKHYKRK
ncbi:pyruvate-flavodoxin oxidoreductase-related [Anaeramoeba ignava]|uniref:Pyruvate-flavodoxin oxidoreductase-related n=1 Tax=Anaeramoeba ignava TaxID=1746090 RepID=A0A9Q0RBG5_ANAIG|nr:pyruvate-flavodoxin oxidoreductase-related [Anaeramoeba ignava]